MGRLKDIGHAIKVDKFDLCPFCQVLNEALWQALDSFDYELNLNGPIDSTGKADLHVSFLWIDHDVNIHNHGRGVIKSTGRGFWFKDGVALSQFFTSDYQNGDRMLTIDQGTFLIHFVKECIKIVSDLLIVRCLLLHFK